MADKSETPSERFMRVSEAAADGDREAASQFAAAAASWLAHGIRVGEPKVYRGEQLREIGLEPNPDNPTMVATRVTTLRVAAVAHDTITVSTDMSEKIEPALTTADWAARGVNYKTQPDVMAIASVALAGLRVSEADANAGTMRSMDIPTGMLPAIIALCNAALPDSNPRDLPRERVVFLRELIGRKTLIRGDIFDEFEPNEQAILSAIADALESYLPPE